jgi:CubicO group peptidase (beta-lactamase class C family)
LGFDTPVKNGSSSGKYFSEKSVGHLGFSGTSFWIDPEKDVVVVLLSNRVHPSRENTKIKQFRPYFHDMVIKTIIPT